MNYTLEEIYTNEVGYTQAQEICRKVLIQKIDAFEFKNTEIKDMANDIAKNTIFPIEYKTEIEPLTIHQNGYKNIAYGLFAVGTVLGATLLFNKFSSDFLSIASGLCIGLSFYLHKTSKQTDFKKRTKIATSQEILTKFIEKTYKNLTMLNDISAPSSDGTRKIDKELLRWFQNLHSWACRVPKERAYIKEEIEEIMLRFGYEFCEYTSVDADFFEATNANIESVTTTVYALFNANDHCDIILNGKVVFPIQ